MAIELPSSSRSVASLIIHILVFYAALVAIQAEPLAQERKDMQMILQAEVVSARQLLAEELIGYFTSLDVSHEVSWCCKRCRSAL